MLLYEALCSFLLSFWFCILFTSCWFLDSMSLSRSLGSGFKFFHFVPWTMSLLWRIDGLTGTGPTQNAWTNTLLRSTLMRWSNHVCNARSTHNTGPTRQAHKLYTHYYGPHIKDQHTLQDLAEPGSMNLIHTSVHGPNRTDTLCRTNVFSALGVHNRMRNTPSGCCAKCWHNS